jgi:hypothetical protein
MDLLEGAYPAAEKVAQLRTGSARDQILWGVDHLLAKNAAKDALSWWNLAAREHLIPLPPIAPGELANADFRQPISDRGFDWHAGASQDAAVNSGSGLRIALWGKQSDRAILVWQAVTLEPEHLYLLRYRFRTTLPPDSFPLRWELGEAKSEALNLEAVSDAGWAGDGSGWREGAWKFPAKSALPPDANAKTQPAVRLALLSEREGGRVRREGSVDFDWVRLEAVAE